MYYNHAKNILRIDSSVRNADSMTRKLADEVVSRLVENNPNAKLVQRDVSSGTDFIDGHWVEANYTDKDQRTESHKLKLSLSDQYVDELKAADTIVLAAPIYNFSIPAALKAWIDQICRARETFRYTENGPEGLLKGKTVYLVMASGGVPFGSEIDFASGYLKQVLRFIGIEDVRNIFAEGVNTTPEVSETSAMKMIDEFLPETAVA